MNKDCWWWETKDGYETASERENSYESLSYSLHCVCVFFQANKENNKKISLSSCNSQTALLLQITVCSPGVNIGCWCDMLGDMCSSPECYSVHAVKGARSQAAGRTPVSKGTSQDRPLKWCQTTD